MWDVVVCWTIPKLDHSSPVGLVLSEGYYKTEIAYAYPTMLRLSNQWNNRKLTVDPDFDTFLSF
jgi:hypothetical protein